MKNMETETKWSIVFAIVTVIAVIGEVISNGISVATIFSAVKDISGTAIVFAMLIVFIRSNRKEKLSFDERLEKALINWQQENSNMVVRKPENDKNGTFFSLDTKTDVSDFYTSSGETKKTGLFLRMPPIKEENYNKGNIFITFFLNKGTFFGDIPESNLTGENYRGLSSRFTELFNAKHSGLAKAKVTQDKEITVTVLKPIVTDEDIEALIDAINTMYTSYLVSARIKVK